MNAPALPKAEVAGEGLSIDDWLSERRIGGSTIAGILGHNQYESPYSTWARMRGEMPAVRVNEAMIWGTALEQPIAEEWSKRSGIASIQPPPITIYRSKDFPLATASPDRLAVDENGEVNGWVEIKNVGRFKLEEWDDGIPEMYWDQAQWELAVSGLPICHVAALVGGQDLRWRRVEADPEWQAMAFEEAEKFWHLVENGIMPDVDGSDATRDALRDRYLDRVAESVEGGLDLALSVAAYLDASEAEKAAKSAKNLAQNQISMILRENEVGTVEGVPFVSIKTVHRGSYEVAPSDYPRLTVLKGAKK